METGKPQSVNALLYSSSVAVPTERKMDMQGPLTAVYIQTVPACPPQLYTQTRFPLPPHEPAVLHLAVPPIRTKDTLPFLTLHIAGGLQPLRQEPGQASAIPLPAVRPKSVGKHICPHCSRDCMKPSVLEKHLRCHTGERPYPCTTCRVFFKTQSNLYKHKRTQAHARLSSRSEQSSLGSQDSLCGSSLDSQIEEAGNLEEEITAASAEHTKGSPSEDPEQSDLSLPMQETEPIQSSGRANGEVREKAIESSKLPGVTSNRHLPIQRQEATLFFKQWDSAVSRVKPQSHESTDSGFSESTDHNMDSLVESTAEHHKRPGCSTVPTGLSQSGEEPKDGITARGQSTLEERISKLISENIAVVEDKQLEIMRPRKTALSKQGSIDLPLPYTYKDSFHFDMRINSAHAVGLQGGRRAMLHRSVPTQHSASTERAPLTRSSSLPYSVALLNLERSNHNSSYQGECDAVAQRGSYGPVNLTAFSRKSVDQQVSAHRPLVRQAAVDCNHTTDGLFVNSPAEKPQMNSNLSCDGGGGDVCRKPSDRKCQRRKLQKFTYNKWYAYNGGTFKKLYNLTKDGRSSVCAAKEPSSTPEHTCHKDVTSLPGGHHEGTTMACSTVSSQSSGTTVWHPSALPAASPPVSGIESHPKSRRVHQSCTLPSTQRPRNLSLSTPQSSPINPSENHNTDIMGRTTPERPAGKEKHTHSVPRPQGACIPSDRKKQRTNVRTTNPLGSQTDINTLVEESTNIGVFPTKSADVSHICLQSDQRVIRLEGTLLCPNILSANEPRYANPPTSVPLLSTTTTSFLPKYQLRLPNAAEPKPNILQHTLILSKRKDSLSFTTSVSSPSTCQSINEKNVLAKQLVPPTTSMALRKCEGSLMGMNREVTPAHAISHRPFTTVTVAQGHCKESSSTTVTQTSSPFNAAEDSASEHNPRPVVPVSQNQPIVTFTTGRRNSQSPASTFTQGHHSRQSHACSSHTPSSGQLHRTNAGPAGLKGPVIPFQMSSFDPGQLDPVQKVFHVQTADLQICLQIISDEQLALIEPRIEKQPAPSETWENLEPLGEVQAGVQGPALVDNVSEGRAHGHTQTEPALSPDLDSGNPSIRGRFNVSQSQIPQFYNLPSYPHNDANLNIASEARAATCHAVCNTVDQMHKENHSFSLSSAGERLVSETPSRQYRMPHTGDMAPLLPSMLLQEDSQHKHLNQRATYDGSDAAGDFEPTTSQGGEAGRLPQQGGTHRATDDVETDDRHLGEVMLFTDEDVRSNVPGQVNPNPPVYICDLAEPGSVQSDTCPQPFRLNDTGHIQAGPLVHSPSSQGTTLCESPDSQHFGPRNVSSLARRAGQEEPETQGRGWSALGRPDSPGWGSAQSQEAWEPDQQCLEVEGKNAQVVPWENSGLSKQPSSIVRSGMSEGQARPPPKAPNRTSDCGNTPAGRGVSRPPLESEINRVLPSRLPLSESGIVPARHETQSSVFMRSKACFGRAGKDFNRVETSSLKTRANPLKQNLQMRDTKQMGFPPPADGQPHRDTVAIVHHTAVASCSEEPVRSTCCPATDTLLSAITPLPRGAPHERAGNAQATHDSRAQEAPLHGSRPWTFVYPELATTQEVVGGPTQEHTSYGMEGPRGADFASRYEDIISAGHLTGYQFGQGSGPVRPVLHNCQENQDESSSDDEGKLIIEL